MDNDRATALRLTALNMALDHYRDTPHRKDDIIELAEMFFEYIRGDELYMPPTDASTLN